ncbi:MAG: carnitine dehydratase, partial [Rhodobacter sp.]|nr:carnitine dehydratase [Rhodobacter sp.]
MDRFSHYIDGSFDAGTAVFESLDPATGAPWALMPLAGEVEVDLAVQAAHRAFHQGQWPAMTATARGKLLYRLADLVQAAAPRLAALETRDTGKII